MPDPFDLSQYVTSFKKVSNYVPQTFQFADFDIIFSQVAEAIRMRQAGISVGFSIPENAFINVESYDTTSPTGLIDSIERFQDAIRELVYGNIIEEYGKLPDCDVYVGFFHYSGGLPIIGVSAIAPNGVDFTPPPDPFVSANIIEFAKDIGSRINELIYALNILRYLHGKMYIPYPHDDGCNPPPSLDCTPIIDQTQIRIQYETYSVKDHVIVLSALADPNDITTNLCNFGGGPPPYPYGVDPAHILFDSGCCGCNGDVIVNVNPSDLPPQLVVIPNCDGGSGTAWWVHIYYLDGNGTCQVVNTAGGDEGHCLSPPPISPPPPPPSLSPSPSSSSSPSPSPPGSPPPGSPPPGSPPPGSPPPGSPPPGSPSPSASPSPPPLPSPSPSPSLSPSPPPSPPPPGSPPPGSPPPGSPPPGSPPPGSPPPPPPPPPPPGSLSPSGCFLAGTLITMGDGSKKPIETVIEGEEVLGYYIPELPLIKEQYLSASFSSRDGQFFKNGKVLNARRGSEKQHYVINKKIKATHEHPFFIKFANQWRYVEAQALQAGFKMLDEQQNEVEITSIELVLGVVETFNLTVRDVHSFIADTFIVHNAQDIPSTKTGTTTSFQTFNESYMAGTTDQL